MDGGIESAAMRVSKVVGMVLKTSAFSEERALTSRRR
jgi:hypothetical protein